VPLPEVPAESGIRGVQDRMIGDIVHLGCGEGVIAFEEKWPYVDGAKEMFLP
jgi:hypothetical protein